MADTLYLEAGKLVTFSCGEYSDYHIRGSYVALQNVTQQQANIIADKINNKAKQEEENTGWYDGDTQSEFEDELIRRGWLLSVSHTEHHIGSYGELKIL